ncbi:MAG: MFS transporter, partial [Bacteroidaceae bacterium]
MSKKITFTILSMSLLTVMAGAAVAPALGIIGEHFSGVSPLLIKLIVSLPAVFIVVMNLAFGMLCRWFRSRTLAIGGLLLYVVSGVGAYFADNIWLMLVLRALLGVSVGVVMPLSVG